MRMCGAKYQAAAAVGEAGANSKLETRAGACESQQKRGDGGQLGGQKSGMGREESEEHVGSTNLNIKIGQGINFFNLFCFFPPLSRSNLLSCVRVVQVVDTRLPATDPVP